MATNQYTTRTSRAPTQPDYARATYRNVAEWRENPHAYLKRIRDHFPPETFEQPTWVCFRLIWDANADDGAGKWSKRLTTPHGGWWASHSKPDQWGTFDEASRCFMTDRRQSGLGFVLTHEAGVVGIDFDHCLSDEGVRSEVLALVRKLGSYAEVSPSGDGIHCLVRTSAVLPKGVRDDARGIEVYPANRFLTVTGDKGDDRPREIRDATEWLVSFYRDYAPPDPIATKRIYTALADPFANLTVEDALEDQRVLNLALTARNGQKFRKLFVHGDMTDYADAQHPKGNHSSADFGLLEMLAFWTREDPARMDRVFRQSKLMRHEKWDRPTTADGYTYGQFSIQNLLQVRAREKAEAQISGEIA